MRLLALLVLLVVQASRAVGQVELRGGEGEPAAALLREILARGDYRVVDRDTVLGAGWYTRGDLVVMAAVVRLEGTVGGSVAVVDGVLFLRPGSSIQGSVVSLGGEVHLSQLGSNGPTTSLPPSMEARVSTDGQIYLVDLVPPPGPPPVRLSGLGGAGMPAYNRVDGLTLRLGAETDLRGLRAGLRGAATLTYYAGRGDLGGAGRVELPVGNGGYHLSLGGLHGTVTNEDWIRGELENSLSALLVRSDVRNYHESSAVSLRLEHRAEGALLQGEGRISPFLGVLYSQDRSLAARDPWSLTGGGAWRVNPPISEGTVVSASAGARGEWRGPSSGAEGVISLEWAPPGVGDFDFTQLVADLHWRAIALWGHRLGVRGHARASFGPDGAPRQRWSFVGGPGTLPTEPVAALHGDQLVFLESVYGAPLPRITLPLGGSLELQALHAVGVAWRDGVDVPAWEQNLGLGLAFSLARLAVYVNPGRPLDATFAFSAQLPL